MPSSAPASPSYLTPTSDGTLTTFNSSNLYVAMLPYITYMDNDTRNELKKKEAN